MINQNEALLKDFTEYCKKYPGQRFWQALRNWADVDFVLIKDDYEIQDTFYFSGKKGIKNK